jgi:hypothetical protein
VYSLEDYYTPSGEHVTRENINNVVSPFELADSYFPHFAMAVKPVAEGGGGAGGVMMAMNGVNGVPALANSQLIDQLKQWAGSNNVRTICGVWPSKCFSSVIFSHVSSTQLYITTDGGNMIDSMLAPKPAGHFYCPYVV